MDSKTAHMKLAHSKKRFEVVLLGSRSGKYGVGILEPKGPPTGRRYAVMLTVNSREEADGLAGQLESTVTEVKVLRS